MGPPQISANIKHNHHFRFTVTATCTKQAINAQSMLATAGVMSISATAGYAIHQSVRLNRIEIWCPTLAQGSAQTCSVLFPANVNSPAMEISDTSVSVAQPAHVIAIPPANSLCSFWTDGTVNSDLFYVTASVGAIVDVWLSLVFGDGPPVTAVAAVLVGASTGVVYYPGIDNLTLANSKIRPVSLTSL